MRRKSQRRGNRRRDPAAIPQLSWRQVVNPYRPLEFLSADQVETIHQASLKLLEHVGIEFIYILEGSMRYRHGNSIFDLSPGDSLFFDSDVTHGPEELLQLPIRFLAVLSRVTSS